MFNDVAVASNLLLARGQATQILTVDLDVHQGGTAHLMANEPGIYLQYAWRKNYPFRKQASDLDIDLPNETGDEAYLAILMDTLPDLLQK